MIKFCFLELKPESKAITFIKELELQTLPRMGEKIVIPDDSGIGYVFKIVDIHHGESGTDVFGLKITSITEYNYELKNTGEAMW